VLRGLAVDMHEAYRIESEISKEVFASDDAKEGPAAFAEKRPPAGPTGSGPPKHRELGAHHEAAVVVRGRRAPHPAGRRRADPVRAQPVDGGGPRDGPSILGYRRRIHPHHGQPQLPGALFFRGDMVRKVVTTYSGDSFPTYTPNPVFQKAYASGAVEVEHWSILTFTQTARGRRARPARHRHGFPRRFLHGRQRRLRHRRHPFGAVGLLAPLVPDVTLVHGAVADESGNVALSEPLLEGVWGAWAARRGVIATVEKRGPEPRRARAPDQDPRAPGAGRGGGAVRGPSRGALRPGAPGELLRRGHRLLDRSPRRHPRGLRRLGPPVGPRAGHPRGLSRPRGQRPSRVALGADRPHVVAGRRRRPPGGRGRTGRAPGSRPPPSVPARCWPRSTPSTPMPSWPGPAWPTWRPGWPWPGPPRPGTGSSSRPSSVCGGTPRRRPIRTSSTTASFRGRRCWPTPPPSSAWWWAVRGPARWPVWAPPRSTATGISTPPPSRGPVPGGIGGRQRRGQPGHRLCGGLAGPPRAAGRARVGYITSPGREVTRVVTDRGVLRRHDGVLRIAAVAERPGSAVRARPGVDRRLRVGRGCRPPGRGARPGHPRRGDGSAPLRPRTPLPGLRTPAVPSHDGAATHIARCLVGRRGDVRTFSTGPCSRRRVPRPAQAPGRGKTTVTGTRTDMGVSCVAFCHRNEGKVAPADDRQEQGDRQREKPPRESCGVTTALAVGLLAAACFELNPERVAYDNPRWFWVIASGDVGGARGDGQHRSQWAAWPPRQERWPASSPRSSTACRPTSMPSTPLAASTVARSTSQYQADDTGSPTNDTTQARNLVEQDHVFAVVGVGTPFFDRRLLLRRRGHPSLRLRGHPGLEHPSRSSSVPTAHISTSPPVSPTRCTWPGSSRPSRWRGGLQHRRLVGGRLPVGDQRLKEGHPRRVPGPEPLDWGPTPRPTSWP
jgi:hypothetical protein